MQQLASKVSASWRGEEDCGYEGSLFVEPCMAQNTVSLQAPQKSQLSDRVMEDADMRERERETVKDREREGEGAVERGRDSLCDVELDVLACRGIDFQEHNRPSVPLHKVVPSSGIVN